MPVELQYSRRNGALQLIGGAGYVSEDENFPDQLAEISTQAANIYVYGQWSALDLTFRHLCWTCWRVVQGQD